MYCAIHNNIKYELCGMHIERPLTHLDEAYDSRQVFEETRGLFKSRREEIQTTLYYFNIIHCRNVGRIAKYNISTHIIYIIFSYTVYNDWSHFPRRSAIDSGTK